MKSNVTRLSFVKAIQAYFSVKWRLWICLSVRRCFALLFTQACLPIIDDLSRSAMRPRHWKQLVRVTGGAVQISNEGLTRMTLGQLLELGLHSKWLTNP